MEKNLEKRRKIDKLNLEDSEWDRVNTMLDILAVSLHMMFVAFVLII